MGKRDEKTYPSVRSQLIVIVIYVSYLSIYYFTSIYYYSTNLIGVPAVPLRSEVLCTRQTLQVFGEFDWFSIWELKKMFKIQSGDSRAVK